MTPHISTTLLRTQSDERLVRLAAEGHERAFEAIVERYRRPLTRFAQRYVGEARAEEVVQTAFLNAWNSLRSGTDVHDLKPWLYRIVNNGAINAMQKSEYGDAPLIEASDARLGPEAAYEQSEELRLTVQNIGELPDRQREALLAVAVDGRAHADVATELGVSDAGVRQLVRRARVQLRTAATAITPLPLALWLADGGFVKVGAAAKAGAAAAGQRGAELGASAGGSAAGGAAIAGALKTGAVVAGVAAVAAGGTEAVREVKKDSDAGQPSVTASSPARERMLIPGLDPSTMRVGSVPQVRVVTGPDGRTRLVAQVPGSSPSVPGSGPGSYGMPMPAAPIDPPGRQDGAQQYAGLFDGTMPSPPSNRGGRGGGDAPRQVAETGPGSGGAPSSLPGQPSPGGNPSQGQDRGGRDNGGNSGGGGKSDDRPSNSGGGGDSSGGESSGGGNGGGDRSEDRPSNSGGGGKSEDRPSNTGGGDEGGKGNGGGKSEDRPGNSGGGNGGGKSEDRPGNSGGGGGKGNGGGKGRGGN